MSFWGGSPRSEAATGPIAAERYDKTVAIVAMT
jgi:hypothetical protein